MTLALVGVESPPVMLIVATWLIAMGVAGFSVTSELVEPDGPRAWSA